MFSSMERLMELNSNLTLTGNTVRIRSKHTSCGETSYWSIEIEGLGTKTLADTYHESMSSC